MNGVWRDEAGVSHGPNTCGCQKPEDQRKSYEDIRYGPRVDPPVVESDTPIADSYKRELRIAEQRLEITDAVRFIESIDHDCARDGCSGSKPHDPRRLPGENEADLQARVRKERRERIATAVLAAILCQKGWEWGKDWSDNGKRGISQVAIEWADALIAELDKPTPQEAPHPADLKERFR